jgi:hypothetical protein
MKTKLLKRIFVPKRKEIIREKYTLRSFIISYALQDQDLRYGSTYYKPWNIRR